MVRSLLDDMRITRLNYHVAASCSGCRLCEAVASENFARIPGTEFFRVVKQPESWEEEQRCEEAKDRCHMHVIRRRPLEEV